MASRLPRSAISGNKGHYLLELTLGGVCYRYSDEELSIAAGDGHTYRYGAGLSDLTSEWALDTGSPTSTSVTLTSTGVDWALLASEGQDLTAAECTIRRWFEGQQLEAARIICFSGKVDSPEYGHVSEPFVFTVENYPWVDTGLVPSNTWTVSDLTWPTRASQSPDPGIYGAYYPVVVGRPGLYRSTGTLPTGFAPTSPALLVEFGSGAVNYWSSRAVIAGHAVVATSVYLQDLSNDTYGGGVMPVYLGTDLLGQTVSYIDFSDSLSTRPALGDEYRICWTDYGAYNLAKTGGLHDAGEVLYWLMLTYSTVPLNHGLAQAQFAPLQGFKLDFYINDPVGPYDWIVSNLAPILPIGWVETGLGGFFVAWNFGAKITDATAHLDVDASGGSVIRSSSVTYTPRADVCNVWTLSYAFDENQGSYRRTAILDDSAGDADEAESYLCRLSISRYGRNEKQLETKCVYDDATARLILRTLARRYAIQRRKVTYQCPPEWESVLVGDVITVTDSELYLTLALALVWDLVIDDQGVTMTLLLLDNPDQITRSIV